MKKLYRTFISIGIILLIWYIFSIINSTSSVVPSPFEVIYSLISGYSDTAIYNRLMVTLWITTKCLFVGCLSGYMIGLVLARFGIVRDILYPILNGVRSIPITSFIPVLMMIFGLFNFVIPMVSIPILSMIAVNISKAISSCDSNRRALLTINKIPYSSYLINIVFWETLEVTIATLRIAIPFALALVIAIEYFIGINRGIGQYIFDAYHSNNYVSMYGGILLASMCGISVIHIIDLIGKRMLIWKRFA